MRAFFCFVTFLLLWQSPSLEAQIVKYNFTGTVLSANEGVGNSITGTVTLDLSATPVLFGDFGNGQFAQYRSPGFSINAITDLGFIAGTDLGGETYMDLQDVIEPPINEVSIESRFRNTQGSLRAILLDSRSHQTDDGKVSIPNPWDPISFEESFIYVSDADANSGAFVFGKYSIESFELVPQNIMVAGVDSGIQDFQYQGKLVTELITDLASNAKNHGSFVSGVSKLVKALEKASLLTHAQRETIKELASESSVGK
ncbi:MAG: hypothetical protein U0930_09115 [Pirellulales bacterium]